MAQTVQTAAKDSPVEDTPRKQARVFAVCLPRSTSSIFARCMSEVPNSEVFFDAQYCCIEAEDNLHLMGKTVDHEADDIPDEDWQKALEMLVGEDCSKQDVRLLKLPYIKKLLDNPNPEKDLIFCKLALPNIECLQFPPEKCSNYKYTFLVRHPIKVFQSYRNVIYSVATEMSLYAEDPSRCKAPSPADFHFARDSPDRYVAKRCFFKELYDAWIHVKEHLDPNPIIIDSDDLLSNPAGMLSKYCAAVGVEYSDGLLKWEADPECCANWKNVLTPLHHFKIGRIFCGNALNSTHFLPPSPIPSIDDVTEDVRKATERAMPYYQEMYEARMLP
ncbi:uncharacterized protein [Diadema antillarum]|uniref:uncharacterized protein n=1 Tax=Diadema antillarum TaxID=105358 RepID=UPI003A87CF84